MNATFSARSWLLLLLLACTTTSCGGGDRGGGDNRAVQTLHLYTSLDAQEAPVYIDAFTKDTGIPVEWVRLSAGEALARLEAEKNNPQVSLWFGGPSPEYIVAAQRGLLESFTPPSEFALDALAHGANGEWTGFYSGVIAFACNKEFLAERQMQCPDSWQALLDPRLKGHISVAYPYTSGTAYVLLVGLLELMGEEAGWEYVRRLDAQVHRYNTSGTAAVTQVGLGEVGVGIAFAHDILKKGVESGYPVTMSVPSEGTSSEVGAAAVVKGGTQSAEAQRFLTWLLTQRAQNLMAQFYRVPLNPAAQVAEAAVLTRSVKVAEYDAKEAAEKQPVILDRWRKVTGR